MVFKLAGSIIIALSSLLVAMSHRRFLDKKEARKHEKCHHECRQEDVFIGHEGGRAVVVDDGFRIGKNCLADVGAHHPGNQHLGEDPQALELAGLALGGEVPDIGAEHRHTGQISAHHQQRADKHKQLGSEEKQHDKSCAHPKHGKDACQPKALFIVHPAPQRGCHRRKNDGRCHDHYVITHAKRNLIINDEIRHEDLNGDIQQHEYEQGIPHHHT